MMGTALWTQIKPYSFTQNNRISLFPCVQELAKPWVRETGPSGKRNFIITANPHTPGRLLPLFSQFGRMES